jgi:hypothetical protein
VTTIGGYTFGECPFTELTIPSSIQEISGGMHWSSLPNLTKVVWNSTVDIGDLSRYDNLACWLIINTSGTKPIYGPNWTNIVINGKAEKVVLPYQHRQEFTIPKEVEFIGKISYTMPFNTYSSWNQYSQWETISLPFKPTSITHPQKGALAPFDNEAEGVKNFWLRELTTEGFIDVPELEANHPYIIAMPNSSQYDDIYNITGEVTFSAENIDCKNSTDSIPMNAVGTDYTMYPSYSYVEPSDGIYVLSTNGFVNNTYDIYPFEAYIQFNTNSMRSVVTLDAKRTATRSTTTYNRKPQKDDI